MGEQFAAVQIDHAAGDHALGAHQAEQRLGDVGVVEQLGLRGGRERGRVGARLPGREHRVPHR
ncbi:hypothetical protein D3C83_287730 [compost metagenome]